MKLVIVSMALMLCSVSASPTPQIFGYQPSTQVGQWVSNNLQNSLQSVANAIQSITRPSQPAPPGSQLVQIAPNQIPNGPEFQIPPVQPVPFQTGFPMQTISVQPYQPGFYQPGPYQQPGQYQPGPYDQFHVIPVPPPNAPWPNGGIPPRNGQGNDEQKPSNWIPLPLYSQFGDPTIVIISRPPSKPTSQPNATTSVDDNPMNQQTDNSTNSTNPAKIHTNANNSTTTTNIPQNEQTSTSNPGTYNFKSFSISQKKEKRKV